jgi:ABC-type polysaccharide/polyol phosphate export permease
MTVVTLAETAVVVLLAPGLTLHALTGQQIRPALASPALSPVSSAAFVLSTLTRPALLVLATIATASSLIIGVWVTCGGVSWATLLVPQALVLVMALGLLALGACCSVLCHTVPDAAGVAYAGVACLVGGVLLVGPLVRHLAHVEGVIQGVLLLNPLVAVSTALGLDLMRTAWLYALSPIGQRQFVPPAWYMTFFWYLLTATGLFGLAAWRLAHRRHTCDRWQGADNT